MILKEEAKRFWEIKQKTKGRYSFSKTSLKKAIYHLREICYFNVRNVAMKQAICIPIGIDPAQLWTIFFIFEEQYISSRISSDKITVRHFHSTTCFIDDLCTVSDGVEIGRSICHTYLKEHNPR